MAIQQITVQGTCYDVLGNLADTRLVRVIEARRSGELIEIENQTGVVNASGLLKAADGTSDFKLPRNAQVKLSARIVGLDTTGGVWVTTPDSAGPVDLATLIAVSSIPSTGLTVKSNGVALASLIGTLNITGDGAVVTQTAPGVAEMEFTAGAGGGGGGAWGDITGTLADQTDLQAALNAKQPLDADLTALAALSTTGVVQRTGAGTFAAAALLAADIPNLDTAKITTGQFSDARIASAATWNAKQDALGFTAENSANKNQAGGYAGLDGSSKLNPSHLPAIAISNYLGSVASQVAMLALTGERGDWAIRSDENKTYIIIGDDPTQLVNWQAVATPTDLVSSVFGRTGAVTAQANDYNFNQIAGTVALNQLHTDVLIASDIGVSVQAQNDILSDLAGLTQASDKLPYFSSASAMALADLSSFGRSLIDDADASAGRATLGLGALATLATVGTAQIDNDSVLYSKLQNISATQRLLGRNTAGAGDTEEVTASQLLDWIGSTRGSVLYKGASGWAILTPGTSGHVLTSNGAGADPSYQAAGGGGTPGGSDTQVQFNDGGAFGGSSGLVYNKTTRVLTVGKDGGNPGYPTLAWPDAVGKTGFQHDEDLDTPTFYWYGNAQRIALRTNGVGLRSDGGIFFADSTGLVAATYDAALVRGGVGAIRASNSSTGAGSFIIGSSSASVGTSGVGVLAIENGTPPSSSPANCVQLYAEDVAASSELKVRDEAGNITVLGPHSWKRIPGGPSEEMAWSFDSERGDKYIAVDMLRAIRLLEKLTGEKLAHIGKVH